MKRLTPNTEDVRKTIKRSLEKVPGIRCLFVYGAFAEKEAPAGTGVDLIVIGGPDLEELEEVVSGVEKKVGRSIRVYSFTLGEFKEKIKVRDRFVKKALSASKTMLIGDVSNL